MAHNDGFDDYVMLGLYVLLAIVASPFLLIGVMLAGLGWVCKRIATYWNIEL